jgi:hypothetical protein
MKDLLDGHTASWVFEYVLPLAQHFNIDADSENPYYELDMLATYVAEHIKQGQTVVYPVIKSGVMPHGNTRYLINKLSSLGVPTRGIFVSGSETGECIEPISDSDIQLVPALFNAFAKLSTSEIYMRFAITLYRIFDLQFGSRPEDTIQMVYTELSKLNRSVPYTKSEPKKLFGIVYAEAMHEVYRWLELNCTLFMHNDIANMHSGVLHTSLIEIFLDKLDAIGDQIEDEEKLVSMTEDAIVWENIIIWFHLGYFVLYLKEPRIAYNRYIDCAPFRSFTKDNYMELLKSAQKKSSAIVSGTDSESASQLTLPAIEEIQLITKKPILEKSDDVDDGTGRKEIAKTITSLLGTGRVIRPSDITYYLSPNLVAMCTYEYGSKNFKPEAEDGDEFNVKYYFTMNGHKFVLFVVSGYDDTVYGWSVDGPKTLIMLAGDKGYDYSFVVDDPEVSTNYK